MMLTIKDKWRKEIHRALGKQVTAYFDIQIERCKIKGLGYYSSPILFEMAAYLKQSPMQLGLKLKSKIPSCVALTPPGFFNFYCQPDALWQWLLLFKPKKTTDNRLHSGQILYQQRRLDLLLSQFDDLELASLSDYSSLGDEEYRLGLLLMDAVDASVNRHHLIQKHTLLLLKGLNHYFNQMVFLSNGQSILRAKYHLLCSIRDFLYIM